MSVGKVPKQVAKQDPQVCQPRSESQHLCLNCGRRHSYIRQQPSLIMIWSLFLYWAVYGSIIVSLVVVSSLKIMSDVKKSIQEVLLVSVFVYLSWNLSNWIWKKFIPSYIKEKVDPTKKAVFYNRM